MSRSILTALVLLVASTGAAQDPFPRELVVFRPEPAEPVFTGGGKGKWDERIRERGWIIKDGDTFKLWYTGFVPGGRMKLGLATSKDGIAWERHPANPLVGDHWVEDVQVIKDGGRYLMFAEGERDRAHWFTSPDGVKWTRQGPLDVRMTDGKPISEGAYGTPAVFREGDLWHLFYERGDNGIWHATSKDLRSWKHAQDDPVMVPGPGEYDRDQIAVNQIVKRDGKYYAFCHGSASSGPKAKLWSTTVAVSDDLVKWTKYAKNPLFPVERNV